MPTDIAGIYTSVKTFDHVQLTSRRAYSDAGRLIYSGNAAPGSLTSASVWRITKRTYDANGRLSSVIFADGNNKFDNEWDERENLDYS